VIANKVSAQTAHQYGSRYLDSSTEGDPGSAILKSANASTQRYMICLPQLRV